MKSMIELEDPEEGAKADLIAAFNKGYQLARTRYNFCDRSARDYAAIRAVEGDAGGFLV